MVMQGSEERAGGALSCRSSMAALRRRLSDVHKDGHASVTSTTREHRIMLDRRTLTTNFRGGFSGRIFGTDFRDGFSGRIFGTDFRDGFSGRILDPVRGCGLGGRISRTDFLGSPKPFCPKR